jgi:hypothetical protein
MADKTVKSDEFSLKIGTDQNFVSVGGLRTEAIYNLDRNGVATGSRVNLIKKITKEEYDKLPDNSRTTSITSQTTALLGGFPTIENVLTYHAILATKNRNERKYIPNDEALNSIPLAKNATNVSARDVAFFNKEVSDYNNKGVGQIRTVNTFAQNAINKEEDKVVLGTGLAGNAAAAPPPPVSAQAASSPLEISGLNVRDDYGNLIYPKNMSDKQDYIQFLMIGYGAKSFSSERSGSAKVVTGFKKRNYTDSKGTVTLPIQNQISDSNRVEWGAGDINPIRAFAANQLYGLKVNNPSDLFNQTEATGQAALKAAGGDISNFVRTYFIQEAVQTTNLLSRTTGAILNPNVELLFSKPQLRPFTFKFFLAARSDKEATEIKKIIRFFKQGMSVKETATDIFLKAPNVFRIKYHYGNNVADRGLDHPGLNRIKECALTSCSVDYTPNNSYMTFEDGTMTAYSITLQFQELEPITESDYKEVNSEHIGY